MRYRGVKKAEKASLVKWYHPSLPSWYGEFKSLSVQSNEKETKERKKTYRGEVTRHVKGTALDTAKSLDEGNKEGVEIHSRGEKKRKASQEPSRRERKAERDQKKGCEVK
jgi:hypothetical protein